jgi:putative membrane-bound dehydrogenase-like protein
MSHRLFATFGLVLICSSLSAQETKPDPRLAGYRVAPGFKVEIAATEPLVINPVAMTFGDDGRLFVIEWVSGSGPNDRIKVLTDVDGNGTFDKSDIYMDNLELPAGLLFWDGWTYITLGHDVVRFKDKDGDGKFEMRESIATGFGNDNSHHRVSGLTMGPDGWIYITTGDSDAHAKGSDGSTADVLRCGGVFRCKPDGSHMENVAYGMRNPFGNVAFDDQFHIFHTDNDNEGSPGFTGCRILHVVEGGDYGWRLREGARCCQPDFDRATWNGGRPGRLGWVTETGRGAPAGICVLNSAAFPESTRNLLVYPDVFRKLVRAYKVKPAGATYTVDKEFELLGSDDGLFRPDDAEMGPDGALYILDWRTDSGGAGKLSGNGQFGRIYRLTWSGTNEEPALKTMAYDRFAKLQTQSNDALFQALSSPDVLMRNKATLELIRRVSHKELAADHPNLPFTSAPGIASPHVLQVRLALANQSQKAGDFVQAIGTIIGNPSANNRRLGYEAIGRYVTPRPLDQAMLLVDRADADPQAERARALAFGRFAGLRSEAENPAATRRLTPDQFRTLALDTTLKLMQEARNGKPRPDVVKMMATVEQSLTVELMARFVIDGAVAHRGGDAFLRDGYTRGLERLGKPGLKIVIESLKSSDKAQSEVALFTLQGWRTVEGRETLIAEATTSETIPIQARGNLFKALRELGPAVAPEPMAEWLAQKPHADAPARAEAIRVLTAMKERAALPVLKILPALLDDNDAEIRKAALGLAAEVRGDVIKSKLVTTVSSAKASEIERGLALIALRGYYAKDLTPLFLNALATSDQPGLKAELLRTIAASDFSAAAKASEGLLNDQNQDLRSTAISILGQKPETALLVVNRYNAGKMPAEDLRRVVDAIRVHATPEIQAATQTMLKSKLLAAPTGEEATRLREFVTRRGNPKRGSEIFLDGKKGGCAACHRIEGVGTAIGPDLTKIHETMTFDKRVEAILEPSKEIKEGYGTYKVATTDGRTLTGLLLSNTAEGITLKDAQGKEIRIAAAEIDQKGPDKVSLMPAGVVGHLSLDELADLLAFLGDKNVQEQMKKN